MNDNLIKKEQKEFRKQERLAERNKSQRARKIKRFLKMTLSVAVMGGSVVGLGWYISTAPAVPETELISRSGIHWHAELSIDIKGQKQEIPANIGIGAIHQPLHTHATDGVIHMEFEGLVAKKDIKLGQFFDNWGKKFDRNCIFVYCNGGEGTVKMLVNGEPNNDFENYVMKDEDKIEIRYE